MFYDEKLQKYEQILRDQKVEFANGQEVKSILMQMYTLVQIVYEQFKFNRLSYSYE
jgi:hypothetical protein